MSCNAYSGTTMRLTVRNYSDAEILDTRVAVLRGDIDSEDLIFDLVLVVEADSTTSQLLPSSVKIIRKSFSAIVRLFDGTNTILFQYKDKVVGSIRLTFLPKPESSNKFLVQPLIVYSKADESSYSEDSSRSSHFRKILVGLELLQWFFSEKFLEAGFSRRSFSLSNSVAAFGISYSPSELKEMKINQVWEALAREISQSTELWSERKKYVAFLRHPWKQSNPSSGEGIFILEPRAALAGGGLVLLDHKLLSSWADASKDIFKVLEDSSDVPDETSLSSSMSTVGRQFGASLGIVAHELGHVFDLGHAESGLMGKDFHRFALSLQPKINSFLGLRSKKYYRSSGDVSEDPVQLSLSCLKMLHYNRWFNENGIHEAKTSISLSANVINAPYGIRVIEVRHPISGIVLSAWTCNQSEVKTKVLLSRRFLPENYRGEEIELVIQDSAGSVLRTIFNSNRFRQGVTSIKRSN